MSLLIVLLSACGNDVESPQDKNWLIGKWELHYDPDGDDKDWLEFMKDGSVTNLSQDGREISGEYEVSGNIIELIYSYNGKKIPMKLSINTDRNKLLYYSKNTKNTSEYMRIK